MTPVECRLEAEVLAAVLGSRWPGQIGPELRLHAAGCAICSELVELAGAIRQVREEALADPELPSADRVWHLARIRARREAAAAAGRPITAVQVIALAAASGLLGACFGATSAWFQSAVRQLGAIGPPAAALIAEHGTVAAGIGGVILLVPAAAYLALRRL